MNDSSRWNFIVINLLQHKRLNLFNQSTFMNLQYLKNTISYLSIYTKLFYKFFVGTQYRILYNKILTLCTYVSFSFFSVFLVEFKYFAYTVCYTSREKHFFLEINITIPRIDLLQKYSTMCIYILNKKILICFGI